MSGEGVEGVLWSEDKRRWTGRDEKLVKRGVGGGARDGRGEVWGWGVGSLCGQEGLRVRLTDKKGDR